MPMRDQRRPPARDHLRRRAGQAAAADATTSSTCSSRSPTTRRSRSRRRRRRRRPRGTSARSRSCSTSRRGITGEPSTDEILRRVCTGIRDALGFQNVCARARRPRDRRASCRTPPRAGSSTSCAQRRRSSVAAGRAAARRRRSRSRAATSSRTTQAERAARDRRRAYPSQLNGRGPWAWNRHWLLVPLHDGEGAVIGDHLGGQPERPARCRRPTGSRRCGSSPTTPPPRSSRAAHLGELRFLADHDPLTRLLNRRAFVDRLDGEVARAMRYEPLVRPRGLRPRRLQAAQRPLRPRRRRRGARRSSRASSRESLRKPRRRVPHRRRRVRAARSPRRPRTTRAQVVRASGAARELRRGEPWAADLGASFGVRVVPGGRDATRRRSSASPTRRCTTRSGTAPASASSPRSRSGYRPQRFAYDRPCRRSSSASSTAASASSRSACRACARSRSGSGSTSARATSAPTAPASRTSSSTSCSRARAASTRSRSPRRSTRWAPS